MKISKKQLLILQEGILLDDLSNYTELEKKLLKSLHKRYKDTSIYNLYTSELSNDLHEKWGMPLDISYKIAKIYIYKRDVLFDESRHTIDIKHSEILNSNINKFFKQFESTLPNGEYGEITDAKGNKYEAYLWVYSDSFSFYAIPINRSIERVIFRCELKFTDKEVAYIKGYIQSLEDVLMEMEL